MTDRSQVTDRARTNDHGRVTDRAQSELLGFVLVFGIILTTLLLVSVAGYGGYQSAQEHQRTTNVQPAFELLSKNVDDVVHRGAPSRATELKLADATLSMEESLEITVEGEGFSHTQTAHSIVYDSGSGTEITYTGGMLVRSDEGNAVVFGEPNFVLSEEAVILPLVDAYPEGTDTVGGSKTVLIETRHAGSETVVENGSGQVTIEVTSSNPDAWNEYLEGEAESTEACWLEDETKLKCDTDRVDVIEKRIAVTFA